jgi:hypothetical protein
MLLKGVDEVDLTRSMIAKMEEFERTYAEAAPWAVR